jgi:hypothetical protein
VSLQGLGCHEMMADIIQSTFAKLKHFIMKFTVADVANNLKVEKDLVKKWAFEFSDYLSPKANPSKGKQREFQMEDIRVMAFISLYWEENPDIEHIKSGLNSNSQQDNFLIDELIIQLTPLFMDPPANINETWTHGIIFGGLSQIDDAFFLAKSYKLAGDRLIDAALQTEENWELFCPAIYNYRHATELYLKAVTKNRERSHDLVYLYAKLIELVKDKYNSTPPDWLGKLIEAFNDFDPTGTAFRYGSNTNGNEVWVDFNHLKKLMGWLDESFSNIKKHE